MSGRSVAIAVAASCITGGAQAAVLRPPPGLHPVTTLWSADTPSAVCAIGRTLRISTNPFRSRSGDSDCAL